MKEPFALTTYHAWSAEKFEPRIRYGPPAEHWNTLSLPCEQGGFLDLLLNDGQIVTLANLLEVHRARILEEQRKAIDSIGRAGEPANPDRGQQEVTTAGAPALTVDEDDPTDPFAGDL